MDINALLADKATSCVEVVRPECTLRETAQRLVDHEIGALVVTEQHGRLLGIISERDLIRTVAASGAGFVDQTVKQVMTRTVITCRPGDEIAEVLDLMKSNAIRHMPVLEGEDVVGIVSIRELARAYDLLQVEANTDSLTGLSNRRCFLKTLSNEFTRCRRFGHPFTVAMIDIDHFKHVNDTYGHETGDRVLCAFADLLVGELRSIDLVGRLGGEEFAAMFPETDLVGAELACDRLLDAIREAVTEIDGAKISFTVSMGLAGADRSATSAAAVLRRADQRLYDAKTGGRDRIVVDGAFAVDENLKDGAARAVGLS